MKMYIFQAYKHRNIMLTVFTAQTFT